MFVLPNLVTMRGFSLGVLYLVCGLAQAQCANPGANTGNVVKCSGIPQHAAVTAAARVPLTPSTLAPSSREAPARDVQAEETVTLPIEEITQEKDNWCWAASMSVAGKVLGDYTGEQMRQCRIANRQLRIKDFDCCNSWNSNEPHPCDKPRILRPKLHGYSSAWRYVRVGREAKIAQAIESELSAKRPVLVVLGGKELFDKRHMVVATGYHRVAPDLVMVETWNPIGTRSEFGWRRIGEEGAERIIEQLYYKLRPTEKGPIEVPEGSTDGDEASEPTDELVSDDAQALSEARGAEDHARGAYGSEDEALAAAVPTIRHLIRHRPQSVGYVETDEGAHVNFGPDDESGWACTNGPDEPTCKTKQWRFRFGGRTDSGAFVHLVSRNNGWQLLAIEGTQLVWAYEAARSAVPKASLRGLIYLPREQLFLLRTDDKAFNLLPNGEFKKREYNLKSPQGTSPALLRVLKQNNIPLKLKPRPQ